VLHGMVRRIVSQAASFSLSSSQAISDTVTTLTQEGAK